MKGTTNASAGGGGSPSVIYPEQIVGFDEVLEYPTIRASMFLPYPDTSELYDGEILWIIDYPM